MTSDESKSPDSEARVQELLLTLLDPSHENPSAAMEALCRAHPELASDLRQQYSDHRRGQTALLALSRVSQTLGLRPGDRVGEYELVERLGRGGQGEVWEAQQHSLARRVALKLVLPDRIDDRSLSMFAREARAGGRLQHRAIVAVHGFGEDDGRHWIAQELVPGGTTVRDWIEDARGRGQTPEGYYRDIAQLLFELAEGLEAAHQAGIIHRDLKPQNILVTPDGRPKLTDFGLARISEEPALSHSGEVLGTWLYMSPEQVRAQRSEIDHRTDIFSLGVVLYELLTLERPFTGDTTHQICHRILFEEPPAPRRLRSRVPRDLAVICEHAMEKSAHRRYASMAGFAEDLRRYLENEAIIARPPGVALRGWKWCLRHKTIATTAAAVLVGMATAIVLIIKLSEQRAYALEQQGIAEDEALASDEVVEFLVGTFESQLPNRSQGKAIKVKSMLDVASRRVLSGEIQRPSVRAKLLRSMGRLYLGLGLYPEAEPLLSAAVDSEDRENASGTEERTMRLIECSMVSANLGRLEDAERQARAAIAEAERNRDQLDPIVIEAKTQLASLLELRGRNDEAEALALELLRGLETKTDRKAQQQVAMLRHLRVGLAVATGRLEDAHRIGTTAVEACEREFGGQHQLTIKARRILAMVLQNKGDYSTALEQLRPALEASTRLLGEEHPDTLRVRQNLGTVLEFTGEGAGAIEHLRLAVAGFSKQLGDRNLFTVNARSAYAASLMGQGRVADATAELELAYEASISGELEHDHTASEALHMLGRHEQELGRYERALELLLMAKDIREDVVGEDSQSMAWLLTELGIVYRKLGRYEEAETAYLEQKRIVEALLGPYHVDVLSSRSNLAQLYLNMGKIEAGLAELEQVLQDRRNHLGEHHPDTLDSMKALGVFYEKQNRWDEAESLYLDAVEGYAQNPDLGLHHPRALAALQELGELHHHYDRFEEAAEVFREIQAGWASHQLTESYEYVHATYWVGMSLLSNGNLDEALEILRAAPMGLEQHLGARHWQTVESCFVLSILLERLGKADEALEWARRVVETCSADNRHKATYEAYLKELEGQ